MLEGRFAVCRLDPDSSVPEHLPLASLLSITRTPRETRSFDQVGILASLAQPLAAAGVSIFVVSTYDTDYLLVKEEKLELARESLRAAGHRFL